MDVHALVHFEHRHKLTQKPTELDTVPVETTVESKPHRFTHLVKSFLLPWRHPIEPSTEHPSAESYWEQSAHNLDDALLDHFSHVY
jgi:hypothetical protein